MLRWRGGAGKAIKLTRGSTEFVGGKKQCASREALESPDVANDRTLPMRQPSRCPRQSLRNAVQIPCNAVSACFACPTHRHHLTRTGLALTHQATGMRKPYSPGPG